MPKAVTETKPKKKKIKKPARKVVYDDIDVFLFKDGKKLGPMSDDKAKQLIGWEEESKEGDFGNEFTYKSRNGKRVRCTNNLTNRGFYQSVCNDWTLEILRRKWQFNGETIIIDCLGNCQDGQHRLTGLIEACIWWETEPELWKGYWPTRPTLECLVVVGIDDSDEVVNTIGCGKPRSLTDVIFRSEIFRNKTKAQRTQAARMLSFAVKLLWKRTGANLVTDKSLIPRRAHSESLDFLRKHERLEECVHVIQDLDKEKHVSRFVPPGYASALLYLMGSCASEMEAYEEAGDERGLDWSLWEKAVAFWSAIARKQKEVRPLCDVLIRLDSTGVLGLGEKCGSTIKGWNLFSDGEKITEDKIGVLMTTDEYDQPVLAEHPRCGGIDVGEQLEVGEDDD